MPRPIKNTQRGVTTLNLDKKTIAYLRNQRYNVSDLVNRLLSNYINSAGVFRCNSKKCQAELAWKVWVKEKHICPVCKHSHWGDDKRLKKEE